MPFKMVPAGIKVALFCTSGKLKKECQKVIFDSFVRMPFSLSDQLFFPCRKVKILVHFF